MLHAELLAEAINALRPGTARHVSGRSTDDEREAAARDLERGAVGVVCNAALWTEGFDCPPVACVAIARPTGSRGLFAQMIGRGTRPHAASGKRDVLVLDFAGATRRHRLVSAADVLEGDLPAEVAELAIEQLRAEGGGDVAAAIATAKAELARAKGAPVARWFASEVGDLLGGELDARLLAGDFGPATLDQIAELRGLGFNPPANMTDLAAARVLSILGDRKRRKLCTYKQATMLRRRGVPSSRIRALTWRDASSLLEELGAGPLKQREQLERVTADAVPLRRQG